MKQRSFSVVGQLKRIFKIGQYLAKLTARML